MAKIVINIDNHDQKYTVSEMRRRLAQVLSKLDGGHEVSFSFTATLENYQPARECIHPNGFRDGICHHCQLLEKDAPRGYNCLRAGCTCEVAHFHLRHDDDPPRQTSMPAVLGAPYGLSRDGLEGYARRMGGDTISGEEAPKDQYQIFAELHDITRDEAKARLLGHGYTRGGPAC